MKKLVSLLLGLCFFISCSSTSASGTPNQPDDNKDKPNTILSFCGSFLQPWLTLKWPAERWDKEMAMLKDAGIQYLIYGPALQEDVNGVRTANYPSSLVSLSNRNSSMDFCMQSAQKYGIKIIIGINFSDKWWDSSVTSDWLANQMQIGNQVADELISLYGDKYKDIFYGWYWVWEVDNVNWISESRKTALVNALNLTLDHLTTLSPNLPLWISPFMNESYGLNAQAYGSFWENIFARTHFRSGDVFVPQDCIGAGGVQISNIKQWFSAFKNAVATKTGLKFWSNVETFISPYGVSAPMKRVVNQLKEESSYPENFICFAYSHYNSPLLVCEGYNSAYLYYLKNGTLPQISTPSSVDQVVVNKGDKMNKIVWSSKDNQYTAGYNIYRNGQLIMMLQKRDGIYPTDYTDTYSGSAVYEVSAYNVLGDESSKVKAQ
jgi:hypothetical protein